MNSFRYLHVRIFADSRNVYFSNDIYSNFFANIISRTIISRINDIIKNLYKYL